MHYYLLDLHVSLSVQNHVVQQSSGAKMEGSSGEGGGQGQSWTAALEHERDCRYLLLHVPQWAVDTGQGIFTSSSAVKSSSNLQWRYQSFLKTLNMKVWIIDGTVCIKLYSRCLQYNQKQYSIPVVWDMFFQLDICTIHIMKISFLIIYNKEWYWK